MNKSWVVHYKNKYPGGLVLADESSINVFDNRGAHVVAVRKNGAGQWVCVSDEVGCRDAHSLDPIPKNARVFKHYANGKIGPSEEAKERVQAAKAMAVDGRVPSIAEFKEMGAGFDEKQNLLGAVKQLPPKPFDQVMAQAKGAAKQDVIDMGSDAAPNGFDPNL